MARALLTVLVLAGAIEPAAARACSCVPPRLDRVVVPADGAVDFPTDGTIRVFLTAFPDDVRAALAGEYRLRDAAGREVPLRASVERTRLDLSPVEALRPHAEYTIEQVFAYGADGERVTDTDRLRGAGAPLRGVWFPVSTFRTAARPAARRTITATFAEPSIGFRYGGGDCGPGIGVSGTAQLSSAGPFDVLELHVRGQGVVATEPATADGRLFASNFLCEFDPILVRYQRGLALELVVRDASGAIVGRSGWARPRPPSERVPDARSLRARPGRWAPIPIVAAPPATSSMGPAACPHGFEVRAASVVSSAHGPWMYGARSPLSTDGRTGYLAFAGDESATAPVQLVHLDAGGAARSIATSVAGHPAVVAAASDGALVAIRTYSRTPSGEPTSSASLVALAPSGSLRWSRPLEWRNTDGHRIARGNGRVLVAWATLDADYERTLSYAVLDEQSGRPVGSIVHTPFGIDSGEAEAPAVAHVGDRFLAAWVEGRGFRTGPLRAMVIGEDGRRSAPIQLPLAGRGMPDMVAAGRHHAGFVISHDGRIEWALLDRNGAVRAGPVVVSTGLGRDNRIPRIAYDGEIFAVAWETHPDEGVYVAAVDERGAVSPALRLDRGTEPASTVGIAPAPNGFYATFTANRARTELRHLVCRTRPPPGPVARIPPA